MSLYIQDFYKDIKAWIMANCPENNHFRFSTGDGLCVNVVHWARAQGATKDQKHALQDRLTTQFEMAGLSGLLPFNRNFNNWEDKEYCAECEANECFTNTKRLSWVMEHA